MQPPPPFDPDCYRAANPALAGLDDAAARDHYERTGRAAGLIASRWALREELLAAIDPRGRSLEIGPFCRPLLAGPNVCYLDILDSAGLRARAIEVGDDPAGVPDTIHHVGSLEAVDARYDAVLSSHAIEHQPDLVAHLHEVERVLAPGGAFFLIVPDKRYCFDHHLPESSIAGVLAAHRERRRVHTLQSVIEHRALTVHNDTARHWRGENGGAHYAALDRIERALAEYDAAAGGYIDVHAWQFTPASFRRILETLGAMGLTGLRVAGCYDTPYGRNEFCAVLARADAPVSAPPS